MSKHFFRISNGQYANLSPLPNAHADGDRVEQCFAELGYTPHSRRDLNAAGMRQFLEDFSKITASDQCNMAVFYYSGHGTHDVTTYLIPTDVRISNASDVALNCINYQSILTSLVPSGCPVVLVLDCCRTSTLPASFSINHAGLTAPTEHVFTLFACAEQNPAYDGFQGDDRGPVARFLDEAFQSGRRTNVRETLFFVRGQVKALTGQADASRRKFIHLQEPQIVDPEGLAAQWDWEGRYHGGLRRPPLIRDWRAAAPHVQTRIDAGDLGLLQYYNEVTKFIETEQQLIDFDEFVNDPARIGFLLLTGESGIGKSRFCSTMCQRYQNGNRVTGFLNHFNPNAKGFDWSYWVPERDYILIVDDCNEREELAARMITALQAASMNNERRVRIVLSDRDIAGDIRDAVAAFVPTRAGVTHSVRSMRCDPLAPNGALHLYMDALEYFLPGRTVNRAGLMRESVRQSYASGNPLEILLNAMWHASGAKVADDGKGDRRSLSKWMRRHIIAAARRAQTTKRNDVFAAVATLCGGLAAERWEEARREMPDAVTAELDDSKHWGYVGHGLGARYAPIKPDRLGDAFVYEVLFGPDRIIRDHKVTKTLVSAAWSINSIRTANVLRRLIRAYGYDAMAAFLVERPTSLRDNPAAMATWLGFMIETVPRPCSPGRYQDALRLTYSAGVPMTSRLVAALVRLAPRDIEAADVFQNFAEANEDAVTPQLLEALSDRSGPFVSRHLIRWLDRIKPTSRLLNNLIERVPPETRGSLFALFDERRHPIDDRSIQNRIKYGPEDEAARWMQLACERGIFVSQNFFTVLFTRYGADRFFTLCEPVFRLRPALINHATLQKLMYNDTFEPEHLSRLTEMLGDGARGLVTARHGTIMLRKCGTYREAAAVFSTLVGLGLLDNKHWVSARARLARGSELTALADTAALNSELRDEFDRVTREFKHLLRSLNAKQIGRLGEDGEFVESEDLYSHSGHTSAEFIGKLRAGLKIHDSANLGWRRDRKIELPAGIHLIHAGDTGSIPLVDNLESAVDLIITDPPYGFNTTEGGNDRLRALFGEMALPLVRSLRPGGQLLMVLPSFARNGRQIPFYQGQGAMVREIVAAAGALGRQFKEVVQTFPGDQLLFRPPLYWNSATVLARRVVRFIMD